MYCSTCGAQLVEGRSRCDTCGTSVHRAAVPTDRAWNALPVTATCPRCGYRGEGISYFSKGTHVAAVVGLTLITAGMMGVGGLVYYLVRRDHVVCPRCGRGWGKQGMVALVPASSGETMRMASPTPSAGGSGKQTLSILMFLLAAVLVVIGIAASEIAPVFIASIAATAGIALHHSASIERQKRREALLSALQLPVLQLAGRKGGQLTVTEVAAELGWTMRRAEKVLQSMDDGLRVTSDVTDEGVIVYDFPELTRSSGRLSRGES